MSFLPKLLPPFPFPSENTINFRELPIEKKTKRLENLKSEEKILKILKEQTDLMEKVLQKYKKKDEERMEIYEKRVEKFLKKSEKVHEKKLNYLVISEKIEQSYNI